MKLTPRTLGTFAVVAVALATASIAQAPGCNQTAHIALVKALGEGTTIIDRYEAETCDDAFSRGHFYSNKAPGVAFLTMPWYGALSLFGVGPVTTATLGSPAAMEEMPRSSLWRMTLWGAVLAAFALLLLVRRVGDALVPGYGAVAAVTLGLATLLLPFSVLLFSHALSALLGFAAFVVLWHERTHPSRWRVAGAGVLAGTAIVVEYPMGIVGVVLAGYVCATAPRAKRVAAYAAGSIVALVPLFAYNAAAFGSPLRLSYGSSVIAGHGAGIFGISGPSLRKAVEVLVSGKGLLTLTPVVAAGTVGLLALYRRGHRREALTCAAIAGLFLLYNASYFGPLGGNVPGPRLLVPALPFVALGLAAAYAAWPTVVFVLAAPSLTLMAAGTLTNPMLREKDISPWVDAVRNGEFTDSVLTLAFGTSGWAGVLPFLVLAGAAGALAVASMPAPRLRRSELPVALVAGVVWLVVLDAGRDLLFTDRYAGGSWGLVAASLVLVATVVAVLLARRRGLVVLVAIVPLLALPVPGVAGHAAVSATLAAVTLVLLAGLAKLPGRRPGSI